MVYWSFKHILTFFLDIFTIMGVINSDKDLEILILRQQVRILRRKMSRPPQISNPERMVLATLTAKFNQSTNSTRQRLHQVMLIFKPETVLPWHRNLIRRKWTFKHKGNPGRPGISSELEALIVRLAKENPHLGYEKIQGELLKLGYNLRVSSVRNILKKHRVIPLSQRAVGSWRSFLEHYKGQILASDFFTVETIWLKTLYVFFFIELGTRRIHVAGCTSNPNTIWVAQQARQLVWDLKDNDRDRMAFLIHDNDTKFISSFDNVFSSEGIEILHTPHRALRANAYAERWVRSVREECLDHILIMNENHLRRVLKDYAQYYNHARPHQGLDQSFPVSGLTRNKEGLIRRRDILGGVIHDYYSPPFKIIPMDSIFTPNRLSSYDISYEFT